MKKKDITISNGLKASFAFFFASIITKGISYITTPLYTRLLTATEFGKVTIFLTWLQLFGIIAMFCLHAGVFNNGMIDYPDRRDDYSFSMLILSNIITIIFSILLLSVYPIIKKWVGLEIPFIILMIIVFLFQPAYNFWLSRQRYEYKYKSVFIWSVICALLSPAVALFLLLKTDFSHLYSRIFGAEVALIIIYIGFYFYLGYKNRWHLNTYYWKSALLFNLPLIPHYLSTYLLNSADKIMISNIISESATAYYGVAYSVAAVAMIVWNAINGSLIPYTYEQCKKERYSSINDITIPILLLFALCCVFVIMMAPEVVSIMATEDYLEAIYVIPPIVGGVFFQVQYYIYANIVYYFKKPKYIMFASLIATVLNIVLNYIFISKYGYIAAGYTTVFCYAVQAIIDYIAMKKVVGQNVYNMRMIIGISFVVIVIALGSNAIYGYPIIRYGILLILSVVLFIKKHYILDVIRKIRS